MSQQPSKKAKNACDFCHKRKRTCDRMLPACSTCTKSAVSCTYPSQDEPPAAAIKSWGNTQYFPVTYFLDQRIHHQQNQPLSNFKSTFQTPIFGRIDDEHIIATQYLETLHWWLPITSPPQLLDAVQNNKTERNGDLSIFFLAMKVLLWHPPKHEQQDPKTEQYLVTKRRIADSVISGNLSFRNLQAQVFISIYELGHAIYPAAYLSVGACARYGAALGIDEFLKTDFPLHSPSSDPIETEEKRRTWWAILILDRFTQLGSPSRPLATEDPSLDSILPSDDEKFNRGEVSRQSFLVSSAASVEMGALARMSQAAYLLGLVHKFNKSTSSSISSSPYDSHKYEEYQQLDKTIGALLNLSHLEGQVRRMAVCGQTAICYSALIALHDPNGLREDLHLHELVSDVLKPVADAMALDSAIFLSGRLVSIADASPLLLFWAYQASTIYNRFLHLPGSEAIRALAMMRQKLEIMSKRWLAGRAYLNILDSNNAITNGARA